jgi:hypothetical protein
MAAQHGTLDAIAEALAKLFQPLEDRVRAGDIRLLFAELGLSLPASIDSHPPLVSAMEGFAQRVKDLAPLIGALAEAVEDEDIPRIVSKGLELANTVLDLIKQSEALASAVASLPPVPGVDLGAFAAELPTRLFDYLFVRNVEAVPGAADALDFLGVIERVDVPGVDAQHPAFTRRALHLNQLTSFLSNPLGHLKTKYKWGDNAAFDGTQLLQKVASLLARAGVPALLDTSVPNKPVLDFIFVEVTPKLDVDPKGLLVKVIHPFGVDTSHPFVQDDWQANAVLKGQLGKGLQVIIQPNDAVTIIPPSGVVEGDLMVEWTGGHASGTPYVILGQPGASRLEAKQLVVRAGAGVAWNTPAARAEGELKFEGGLKQGRLVVSLASADGFIGKLLGGFGLDTEFGLDFGFSTKRGFYFHGSATLDIQLPLHVQLGPVEISALTLTVGIQGGAFPIGMRTDIRAALGPLKAVVEQIGVGADISLPATRKGNAGPVDFKLKFLPPKGVGLSLDLAVLSGGGYLFIDSERGEYAGTLELTLLGIVAIKAIGLITTKTPDGKPGFSLLLVLTAEFGSGIQLGFGFTLLAVGGVVGLNRTMNLQALMEGVRTNAVESVMFPKDVVANAPKIISDLKKFFPPEQGKFLIGPMVKLGWGTPTLVSVALGVIIEIPGNIAIVGILKVAIPAEDIALIVLQVNFAGAIEFDKKRIYFFAALFESRVVFITIEGEMGLLVAYGDDANFVVSVGGFHPQFTPPPLPFPSPKRITINILNTSFARITVQGYFAVTSNTVQFGASVDVFFGLDVINVQGHLGFDALFQFSPFKFIISFSASLSVKVFGIGLFSVGLSGLLEGPAPYHIKGHGSISILFFDIDVDFETSWGEARDTTLPPIAVMPLIEAELKKADNWKALPPPSANLLVTLRKLPQAEADLTLHPVGSLRVSQRALPLEITLDKVGNRKPSDANRLSVVVSAGLAKKADAFEQFAPAQFQNFSDSEKLSRPAFAPERAGLELIPSGAETRSSVMVKRVVRYEEIIIDNNYKRLRRGLFAFIGVLFNHFLGGASVTKSDLSAAMKTKLQPFEEKISVAAETYTVAFQSNNKAFSAEAATFHSEASAREFMNARLSEDASLVDELHVIPGFERAA